MHFSLSDLFLFPVSFHEHNYINRWMISQLPPHLSHIIHLSFSFLPAGKMKQPLFVPGWSRGVFKLRYWTGTDLLCVITSLSVWGEISCNIILKYTLAVWEMLSECHNFSFLPQTQIQHLKIKLSTDQNDRAENMNARSRLSLSVCLPRPLCLSLFL